ncbi:MAG: hypothetical protein KDC78_11755 [Aequorivita sp.]|nr:hypothetical protein [Aequorivita sp.]MCB0747377.1 hypothetical protein [Ignavibacteriota bacterium]
MQLIQKELLAIISLFLFIACKSIPREEIITNEAYEIINVLLENYKDPKRPFVIIEEKSFFNLNDFNEQINSQKASRDKGYNPEKCAMSHIESGIKLSVILPDSVVIWDKSRITYNGVDYISRKSLGKNLTMKEASDLMSKQLFSFSNPIFSKRMENASILLDISGKGKILHFLSKKEDGWGIDCKYYIAYY